MITFFGMGVVSAARLPLIIATNDSDISLNPRPSECRTHFCFDRSDTSPGAAVGNIPKFESNAYGERSVRTPHC
ncbi:MAG: hypothetical protein WBD83_14900, partial [Xanthobacteraceae bacterium]